MRDWHRQHIFRVMSCPTNAPSQTFICNPNSQLLSVSFRPFRVSLHLLCLCEYVRLFVKMLKVGRKKKEREREREKRKAHGKHSSARIRTRAFPQAVSFACREPKETEYWIHLISVYRFSQS